LVVPKKSRISYSESSQDSLSNYFTLANDLVLSRENRLVQSKAYEIVTNNENDSLNRVNFLKLLIGFIILMIGRI
jgi:hypothetical protein